MFNKVEGFCIKAVAGMAFIVVSMCLIASIVIFIDLAFNGFY